MRLSNFKVICFLAFTCLCYPLLGQFEKSDLELVELRDELEGIGSELAQLRISLSTKTVEKRKPAPQPVKSSIEEFILLRQELDAVKNGLDALPIRRKVTVPPAPPIERVREVRSEPLEQTSFNQWDGDRPKGLGFYILPFLGTYKPDGLEWKSIGGDFEVGEEHGFSSGIRFGHGWKYFFTDFQLSYFHNELESIDIGLPSVRFSGKTDGMGGHLSAGVKVPVSHSFNLTLGGGLGGTHQDISFLLMGLPVEEEDFLFSYQFFTGLEYHPIDHLRIGIRYRWLRVGETDLFSARNLHLAELSLGYVF